MSTIKILNQSQTGKLITSIGKRAATLNVDIHIAAVSTLVHIRDHSDYTLAIRLLNVLPTGQRVKTLAAWYGHFSGGAATFSFDKNEGSWKCNLARKRSPEQFDIDGAIATPFGDLMPEKVSTTMNVKAVIAMLKKNADSTAVNDDGTPKISAEAKELFASLFVAAMKAQTDAELQAANRAKAAAKAARKLTVVPATQPETDPVLRTGTEG